MNRRRWKTIFSILSFKLQRRWNPLGGQWADFSGYSGNDGEWEYRIKNERTN